MSRPDDAEVALLRELDRSVRWAGRRARAAHRIDRAVVRMLGVMAWAGMWLLEGLVLIGSPWASVPTYGRFPPWGARRRRGADSAASEEDR